MSVKDKLQLKYSDKFFIEGIDEKDINLDLAPATPAGASLTGIITAPDGNPVEGVTVKIFDGSGRPYRHTLTDSEGNYTFANLEAGNYTVTAVKGNYFLSLGTNLILSDDELKSINIQLTENTTASLTVISGIIYDADTGIPLEGAAVRLIDATTQATVATTISADDGEYVFYDLIAGNYRISAIKDGYVTNSPIEITAVASQIINAYIKLTQDPISNTGTISGICKSNNTIVPNCFVGLYEIITRDGVEIEKLVASTKSNFNGAYMFGNIVAGNYKVKAKLNV